MRKLTLAVQLGNTQLICYMLIYFGVGIVFLCSTVFDRFKSNLSRDVSHAFLMCLTA